MEGTKGFELEVLSRNDHVEDLRQNRVHDVCVNIPLPLAMTIAPVSAGSN